MSTTNRWLKIFLYVIWSLFPLLLQGCNQTNDPKEERMRLAENTTGDVVIGVILPSSRNKNIRLDYKNGVDMALAEINQAGGVNGRKVRLLFKDDNGQLSEGRRIAQSFVENPEVVAVIGHLQSYISIPVSTTYQHYGVLMISPFSTNPKLTENNFDLIFRNIPSDVEFGRELARFAKSRGYHRVMVSNANTTYGRGLANEFEIYGQHLGIEVIDRRSFDVIDQVNFHSELNKWKLRRFDAVLIAGSHPQGTQIIQQMRELGINVPVFGSDDLDSPDFIKMGGAAVEGTVIAIPFHPDSKRPETIHFVDAFLDRYGKQPAAFAAQGYDTLKVLTYAMSKAGSIVPKKVAATLHELQNWPGVTGSTTFTENGDVIGKPIAKKIVNDGRFEFLSD